MNDRRNPFNRRNFVGALGASALAQQQAMAMQEHGAAQDNGR